MEETEFGTEFQKQRKIVIIFTKKITAVKVIIPQILTGQLN